jgi:PEP-CTERM motif
MSILRFLSAPLAVFLLAVPAYADLMTFSSRSSFDTTAPGLPVETFEAGLTSPNSAVICPGPVSSAAASACFPLGALLPGVVYGAVGAANTQLGVLGARFGPPQENWDNSSKVFGPQNSLATLDVTFTTGVSAVGFDAFPGTLPGNIAISLFSLSNDLLGTSSIPAHVGANFFGVVSTTGLIGRVNIEGQSAVPFESIDNLAFGTTPVPEPSSLLLFAVGLAIIVGSVMGCLPRISRA